MLWKSELELHRLFWQDHLICFFIVVWYYDVNQDIYWGTMLGRTRLVMLNVLIVSVLVFLDCIHSIESRKVRFLLLGNRKTFSESGTTRICQESWMKEIFFFGKSFNCEFVIHPNEWVMISDSNTFSFMNAIANKYYSFHTFVFW